MTTVKADIFTRYKLRRGHVKILDDIQGGRTHGHGVLNSQLKRAGLIETNVRSSDYRLHGCCKMLPKGERALAMAIEEGWER